MSKTTEKLNKYLSVNMIKDALSSSLSVRKRPPSFAVSDKELTESIFRCDPYIRQFIRVNR